MNSNLFKSRIFIVFFFLNFFFFLYFRIILGNQIILLLFFSSFGKNTNSKRVSYPNFQQPTGAQFSRTSNNTSLFSADTYWVNVLKTEETNKQKKKRDSYFFFLPTSKLPFFFSFIGHWGMSSLKRYYTESWKKEIERKKKKKQFCSFHF